jgi:DNA polymerase-3 subunit epsilon
MASLFNNLFTKKNRDLPEPLQRQKTLKKRLALQQPVSETLFVAFDTELTGLDFKRDSIISIGAIKLQGGRILPAQTFYRLVKPDSELKHQSVVIHEITHTDLKDAHALEEVMEEFITFIDDAVLIGHFVHIDLNFVNRALRKAFSCTLQNPAIDTGTLHDWLLENTSQLACHFQGKTTKTDLFSLAKKYGITFGKAHNAFEDAYITAQLFQRFFPFLPPCGVRTLKELLAVGRP